MSTAAAIDPAARSENMGHLERSTWQWNADNPGRHVQDTRCGNIGDFCHPEHTVFSCVRKSEGYMETLVFRVEPMRDVQYGICIKLVKRHEMLERKAPLEISKADEPA